VVNVAEFLPGEFTRNVDYSLPVERLKRAIATAAGPEKCRFVDASRLATTLLGNAISANIFLVGYAYQIGALPLSAEAIERAIDLNGEAVAMNRSAFRFGRYAAVDPAAVEALAAPREPDEARRLSQSLDEVIGRRGAFLTDYQNAEYAERYRALVEKTKNLEASRTPGKQGLAEAVARYLFKLMAYKDEYEVARLFAGEARLLAKLKFLRGTAFDPFGYTAERRTERALIADYEAMLAEIFARLDAENHAVAVALASIPEKIRGFGQVKARHLAAAKAEEAALLERFRSGPPQYLKAAE
jgi:indolepyruvate ferredoxin oxidoreductase